MPVRKHIYFLLILLSCSALSVYGQNKFEPEWNFGVGAGPTFTAVDFQNNVGASVPTKTWQQFHGGVSVRYMTEKNLGLLGELNYTQYGWQEEFKDNPEFSYSRRLDYVELPLLTHIYFGNKVRFICNLGPKLGLMLGENEEMNEAYSAYLSSGNLSENMITHQYFRKTEIAVDYGILAGMGLEIRTGIGNFTLEGRYYFGLGDMYNNKKSGFFGRSANRVISARLTYFVKLF